jgi:glycosyltransferase involved in cell wall biosynthesis
MKITFVMGSSFTLAGGDRVIAIYADRLQKRGHDVFVVSPPSPLPSIREQLSSVLRGRGLIRPKGKQPSHFDNIDVPHRLLDVYRPVVDADVPDADVVIATWWITAEWVAKLSPAKGAKAYFLQHHEVFDYLPKERVEATWRLPLHKITISRWLVELAAMKYGDSNVSLVPNSVETKQFYAPPRQKQAVPTIGLLYSSTPWKGCSVSFAALERVKATFPDLRVVTFGSSPPSESLPLPEGVEFILQPAQDSIKDLYASCDVWLCGSWSEGFHLPPLEAMACRCPVVSTEVGGPLDIIQNGVNGYLVPVGDSTGLADRVIDVLKLPEADWKTMSDQAHATATRYTWEDAAALFEAALEKTIVQARGSELLDKSSAR